MWILTGFKEGAGSWDGLICVKIMTSMDDPSGVFGTRWSRLGRGTLRIMGMLSITRIIVLYIELKLDVYIFL